MTILSHAVIADQIGSLDAQIKDLQQQLEELKAKAKATGKDALEGKLFKVSIDKSIRASLDTALVKKEFGQQWYDDRCKLAEVTTVRIKPLPGALADFAS